MSRFHKSVTPGVAYHGDSGGRSIVGDTCCCNIAAPGSLLIIYSGGGDTFGQQAHVKACEKCHLCLMANDI